MSLLDTVKRLLRIPSGRQTSATGLGEPPYATHFLTADRLHAILRSAEAGETGDLFALYRDILLAHSHTQTEVNKRKLAVLTKALTIVPGDAKNPADVRAAAVAETLLKRPGWLNVAMNHLLNGHLYPVAVLEQVYEPAPANPFGILYRPAEWAPVPYHLLDYTAGQLQIWESDDNGNRLGGRNVPPAPRYVVHRGHLLNHIPDNWGGPLRAALFWFLFATQDRDWWVRFLDRFGAPFIVGRYESGDDKAKRTLSSAFSAATRLFGLVVSRETEIDVHAVSTNSHGEAFESFQAFANAELSKLILGQTMTTTAQAGGLGGAQAQVQENVRGDIEAWDLTALAQTVNAQIIAPFLQLNGIAGEAVLQVATDNAAELDGKTKFLTAATAAGLEVTDEGLETLSKAAGLPLRRASRPALLPPGALTALAADLTDGDAILRRLGQPTDAQLDGIAAKGAPDLAAAFRGRYAPVADLIAASTSAADLEHKLHVHFADLPAGRVQALIEEALVAYGATGSAQARTA